MSRYTPQPCDKDPVELESLADFHVSKDNERTASILRAYAATLRQQAGRVDEGMVERAASAFMRVRGLGMAKPWEGMLEESRESYRPAFRAALTAALAQNTQGDGGPIKYEHRMRPTWRPEDEGWSPWEQVSEGMYLDCLANPIVHEWQHEVRALYLHAERARVPEGMVLVPREPTPEMAATFGSMGTLGFRDCYTAMIATAPSQRAEVK